MNNLTKIKKEVSAEKAVDLGTVVWIENPSTLYILGCSNVNQVVLISLTDGNRWEDPVTVKFDTGYPLTIKEKTLGYIIRGHMTNVEWGYVTSVTIDSEVK